MVLSGCTLSVCQTSSTLQTFNEVKSTDNELGLGVCIYDLVEKLGPDPQDGNLGTLPLYLFGGTAGNSFLVFA